MTGEKETESERETGREVELCSIFCGNSLFTQALCSLGSGPANPQGRQRGRESLKETPLMEEEGNSVQNSCKDGWYGTPCVTETVLETATTSKCHY